MAKLRRSYFRFGEKYTELDRVCKRLGEIFSICSLVVLFGPVWVLLNKIYKHFCPALYAQLLDMTRGQVS